MEMETPEEEGDGESICEPGTEDMSLSAEPKLVILADDQPEQVYKTSGNNNVPPFEGTAYDTFKLSGSSEPIGDQT